MYEVPTRDDSLANPSLQTSTERVRQGHEGSVGQRPVSVEKVVAAVLDAMHERLSPNEARLLREVAGLGRILEQAKASIAEVSVDAIRGRRILSANGELDAIVEHMTIATNSILQCCELLDGLSVPLGSEQAAVVQGATTRIYEACSSQDITGQRSTKIVKALQATEAKVIKPSFVQALPESPNSSVHTALSAVSTSEPSSLRNGPALPADAMNQSDIDKPLGII